MPPKIAESEEKTRTLPELGGVQQGDSVTDGARAWSTGPGLNSNTRSESDYTNSDAAHTLLSPTVPVSEPAKQWHGMTFRIRRRFRCSGMVRHRVHYDFIWGFLQYANAGSVSPVNDQRRFCAIEVKWATSSSVNGRHSGSRSYLAIWSFDHVAEPFWHSASDSPFAPPREQGLASWTLSSSQPQTGQIS
jgi:hypothetical protein